MNIEKVDIKTLVMNTNNPTWVKWVAYSYK